MEIKLLKIKLVGVGLIILNYKILKYFIIVEKNISFKLLNLNDMLLP